MGPIKFDILFFVEPVSDLEERKPKLEGGLKVILMLSIFYVLQNLAWGYRNLIIPHAGALSDVQSGVSEIRAHPCQLFHHNIFLFHRSVEE